MASKDSCKTSMPTRKAVVDQFFAFMKRLHRRAIPLSASGCRIARSPESRYRVSRAPALSNASGHDFRC
jgi:hypothetical protein